jgi:hypothetical protein
MSTPRQINNCQMTHMSNAFEKETFFNKIKRGPHKGFWAIRRRIEYIFAVVSRLGRKPYQPSIQAVHVEINAGDRVRIKSKDEISATLNAWNEYKGCSFIDDMGTYCGTTQTVFKKVRNFVDERDYRMKRVKGLYLLENVYCQGTRVLGSCDRSCFFFWREEWLEKF